MGEGRTREKSSREMELERGADTPLQSCRMVARTASFSRGLREQVE